MVVLLCGFLLYRLPSSFNSIHTDYFWGGFSQIAKITISSIGLPPSWLSIHRRGSWYSTVVAQYPPSWLMIPHRHGSVSTMVAHDTPPSWLMILHRHGSVSTIVAHDTPPSWLGIHCRCSWYSTIMARYPPSWLMIPHRRGLVSTVVAHDTPPSWLGIHCHGLVHFIQGENDSKSEDRLRRPISPISEVCFKKFFDSHISLLC